MMKIRLSLATNISGAIQPYTFEARAADCSNISAEADHDEQRQTADHLVDISLW